jgi:transcriptional regulator with XRE-family HTH domain
MSLANNIKAIREEKGLKQITVASHIGVDKSAYSKIEKGIRNLTVEELQKMSELFNMTTDRIIHFEGGIPAEVIFEDKSLNEQMKLIQQLPEEDKLIIFKMIEKLITTQKFKDFFHKNVATL